MKTIAIVGGIRPDWIRLSHIIKRLDNCSNLVLINSAQHYDRLLSQVFFEDLEIRQPDITLSVGSPGRPHYEQVAMASVQLIEALGSLPIKPDIVVYLGDSNTVVSAVSVKKAGYKVGHIEACMRSYDRRMPEEINRVVCDHVSDILFAYHEDYKNQGVREGIDEGSIHVVGNTIVEPCLYISKHLGLLEETKRRDCILLDIHRSENISDIIRLNRILSFAKYCSSALGLSVKFLKFTRTLDAIHKHGIKIGKKTEIVDLMSYKQFLVAQRHAAVIISDSGTSQDGEPSLLNTPVIVPRDFTERPQSYASNCSIRVDVNDCAEWDRVIQWTRDYNNGKVIPDVSWLGDGKTANRIVDVLCRE